MAQGLALCVIACNPCVQPLWFKQESHEGFLISFVGFVGSHVKVSVARDRIAKLEAAIAAVGDEDETAPKLKDASRKAHEQAQIPPIKVRVKLCE